MNKKEKLEQEARNRKSMTALIVSIISIIAVIVVVSMIYAKMKKTESEEINYKKYTQLMKADERFILFIGAASCSHCKTYTKTINRVITDYQIKVYYLDVDKLKEEEYKDLNRSITYSGTPTTVVIEKGKEYEKSKTRIEGNRSYDYTVTKLKNAEFIK